MLINKSIFIGINKLKQLMHVPFLIIFLNICSAVDKLIQVDSLTIIKIQLAKQVLQIDLR